MKLNYLKRLWNRLYKKTENRCHQCAEQKECPAFDTGVCFPCPYFQKSQTIEKPCVNYMGPACVDGTCPADRNGTHCLKITDCENCFFYKGCEDCALAKTECEKEEFYHGREK